MAASGHRPDSSRDILKIIQMSQVDGVRSSVHWHSIHTMENELSYSVKSSDLVKNKYFEILKTVFPRKRQIVSFPKIGKVFSLYIS